MVYPTDSTTQQYTYNYGTNGTIAGYTYYALGSNNTDTTLFQQASFYYLSNKQLHYVIEQRNGSYSIDTIYYDPLKKWIKRKAFLLNQISQQLSYSMEDSCTIDGDGDCLTCYVRTSENEPYIPYKANVYLPNSKANQKLPYLPLSYWAPKKLLHQKLTYTSNGNLNHTYQLSYLYNQQGFVTQINEVNLTNSTDSIHYRIEYKCD